MAGKPDICIWIYFSDIAVYLLGGIVVSVLDPQGLHHAG
jgi:hypothetical protein